MKWPQLIQNQYIVNLKCDSPCCILGFWIALVLSREPTHCVGCTLSPHDADKRLKQPSRSQTTPRYELRCFHSRSSLLLQKSGDFMMDNGLLNIFCCHSLPCIISICLWIVMLECLVSKVAVEGADFNKSGRDGPCVKSAHCSLIPSTHVVAYSRL